MLSLINAFKSEVLSAVGDSSVITDDILVKFTKKSNFFDALSRSIYTVSDSYELADVIAAHVNLMRIQYNLDRKIAVPMEHMTLDSLYSYELARQHLLDCPNDFHPFSQASAITTHPVKNDERVTSQYNVRSFTQELNEEDGYGITSADTREVRQLTFSGNAAKLKMRFLLLVEFFYEGNFTSFLEMCLQKHPEMYRALFNLGFNIDQIESIFADLTNKAGSLNSIVGKQVYYPSDFNDDGYEYVLISPLMSVKMQREVNYVLLNGLKDKELNDLYWIKKSKSEIGGAQPQNSSYFLSKMGGFNYMFLFNLPDTTSLSKLESRLLKGVSLLDDGAEIKGLLLSGDVHFDAKGKFKSDVYEWCFSATSLFDEYYSNFIEMSGKNLSPSDELELKVASKVDLTRDESSDFSKRLLILISNKIVESKGELSVTIKKELNSCIEQFVKEFL
jgi:hypothetical protein